MTDFTLVPRADGAQLMSDPTGVGVGVPVEPVTAFWASGESTSSISLSWTIAAGQPVDQFIIKISTDGITYPPAGDVSVSSDQRTYTYVGLQQNTTYYFQVIVNEGGNDSLPATINHTTADTAIPPPGGGPGDGRGVLMDLGYSGVDVDSGQPSYVNRWRIWAEYDPWPHNVYEADGFQEWVTDSPAFTPTVQYRPSRFNGVFDFLFSTTAAEGASNGFLTVRYKDDCIPPWDQGPCEVWSPGGGRIGYLPAFTFDHKWKIHQFPVDFSKLGLQDNRFRIMFGEHYSRYFCGNMGIDMIKLSPTNNYDEFRPATQGYYPQIAPGNERHREIGRTNEYVPGEGPFFPYGGYVDIINICGDDVFTETDISTNPNDDFNFLQSCYVNAVLFHDWGDHDWNLFKRFENEPNVPAGMKYCEFGFANSTHQYGVRGIKNNYNALDRTRRGIIKDKFGNSTDALNSHATDAATMANDNRIWAWNPVDELDHEDLAYCKPAVYMKQLEKVYKDTDPNTPVFCSMMGFPGPISAQFGAEISDIISNDNYFTDSGGEAVSAMSQCSRLSFSMDVFGRDRALISVPFFVFSNSTDASDNLLFGQLRAVNELEVKWQAWYSICCGAQGLQFFRLSTHTRANTRNYLTGLDEAYDGLKEVGRRLFNPTDGIAHALLAPWTEVDMSRVFFTWSSNNASWGDYDVTSRMGVVTCTDNNHPSNSRVLFILRENGSNRILLAVNMDEPSTTATFTIPGMSDGSKEVRFEGRNVTASGGSFTDSFGRLETHTYIIEGTV